MTPRLVIIAAMAPAAALIFFVALADRCVARAGRALIFVDPATTPERPAALVLGAPPWRAGEPNPFFEARMDAAAELYRAGRVKKLLVSGDNAYGEPRAMTAALAARGVGESDIIVDSTALRTYDSMTRAPQILGSDEFIVVSQRFHVERALFIAAAKRIRAIGYRAADPPASQFSTRVRVREILARVRSIWDCYVRSRL